jgi:hypothetical protein
MSGQKEAAPKGKPHDVKALFSVFAASGAPDSAAPFGSGHIHETFRVRMKEPAHPGYILQRVNDRVFPDVPRLMENIVRVSEHMRGKIAAIPGSDPGREVLTVVPVRTGASFWTDECGNYWRCFLFIEHRELGERPGNAGLAHEAGRLFGRFIRLLADLPAPPLHEVIPRFHDLGRRLDDFHDALASDRAGRRKEAGEEIAFAEARGEAMKGTMAAARAAGLPLRVTHNDTKFNNILFDGRGRGLCVIDLDTVMPGYVLYDFGDAIRSAANAAREDEPDAGRVALDMAVFRDFTGGFLGSVGGSLTPAETAHLAFAARLMTFLIGLRFLSDHLDGDRYFKTGQPGHNLQRARVQFRLLGEMEHHAAEMEDIIGALAV